MTERPIECTECKKPLAVDYTEVVGEQVQEVSMCSDCPVWHRKLYGSAGEEMVGAQQGVATGICCGNCGTPLEEVQTGGALGCSNCYEVFGDIIAADLITSGRIRGRPAKGTALHVGRSPVEVGQVSPAIELVALNEALAETLSSEDYEQAAWLRDQIETLKENIDDRPQG